MERGCLSSSGWRNSSFADQLENVVWGIAARQVPYYKKVYVEAADRTDIHYLAAEFEINKNN